MDGIFELTKCLFLEIDCFRKLFFKNSRKSVILASNMERKIELLKKTEKWVDALELNLNITNGFITRNSYLEISRLTARKGTFSVLKLHKINKF